MKKIFLALVTLLATCNLFAQDYYYWYKNTKQELFIDRQRQYITVKSLSDIDGITADLTEKGIRYDEFKKINDTLSTDSLNVFWTFIYLPNNLSEYTNPSIIYSSPSYKLESGIQIGISNLLYVKLKTRTDTSLLLQMAQRYNVSIIEESKYIDRLFTLSCTNQSTNDALFIANELYSSHLFDYAVPDIMADDLPDCVSDTYFSYQWSLNNTGQYGGTAGIDINYCAAQQITSGNSNIIVAVVDQGVENNHPDLTNMYTLSYDTETDASPSLIYGSHGNACAGIIGANANNNIGIAGIAPDCPIMSISNSFAPYPNSRKKRAEGINYARTHGASVINNSWHSTVLYDVIDDAIDSAYSLGRNGKGCILVFSAGNTNDSVAYPAKKSNVLAVGALSISGKRKSPTSYDGETTWGSCYGKQLDIMAPGVLISTTDRVGSNGYNPYDAIHINAGGNRVYQDYNDQDYTIWFNGTSAAAPHVSGVAALMLSVNPNLTAAQVARIIKGTAQKVGGYNYAYSANHLNGTWHQEMGHGLVDAAAAVSAAQSLTNDLYIKDNASDNGFEPNTSTAAVNLSPSIKLLDADGNEVTYPLANHTYTVRVTIHNNGSQNVFFNPSHLTIRWLAKNSNPLWLGSWTTAGTQCGVPLSGTINASGWQFFITIPAGGSTTISRTWTAPQILPNDCIIQYYETPLHIVAVVNDGGLTIGAKPPITL